MKSLWHWILNNTFFKKQETKWLYTVPNSDNSKIYVNLDLKIPPKDKLNEVKDDLIKIVKKYQDGYCSEIHLDSWLLYNKKTKKERILFSKELLELVTIDSRCEKLPIYSIIFTTIFISLLLLLTLQKPVIILYKGIYILKYNNNIT